MDTLGCLLKWRLILWVCKLHSICPTKIKVTVMSLIFIRGGGYLIEFSTGTPAVLTPVKCHTSDLTHDHFVPHSLQFPIHSSRYKTMLYIPSSDSVAKLAQYMETNNTFP